GVMSTGCVARAKVRATSGPGGGPPPEPVHRQPPPDHTAPPPPDRPPPEPPPPARWKFDPTPGGWEILGEREVDGARDRDVIEVGAKAGVWSHVIVVVEDSDIVMHNFVIRFMNGTSIKPNVKHAFREGSRTRQIYVGSKGRKIKDIQFNYSDLPGGGKAKIVVYGRVGTKSQPKSTVLKAGEWDRGGWQLLGTRVVAGKKDHDVIPVKKADGPFTKLMVVVEDSDLEVYDLAVTLGNKDVFTPEVGHYFREDQRTRQIDLPGEARNVKKIELNYGNLPGGGKAKVEVWGRAQ
ncbi:MAG TPA: hypothetical protein VMZ28_03170, partial [Kofleriaceae bacterium]|nr:hypothetical protein [Kofleriaceae bacterium]